MTRLTLGAALADDFQRNEGHLAAHGVQGIEARLDEIMLALDLLVAHPLIGHPATEGQRELVIGKGSRGYLARYRYDRLSDEVIVLALRAQREAGFEDRDGA